MRREKMVYIGEDVHRKLKILAARRDRPMGGVVEELVNLEFEDATNPWLSPGGLALQQKILQSAWDDPALDIYNDA